MFPSFNKCTHRVQTELQWYRQVKKHDRDEKKVLRCRCSWKLLEGSRESLWEIAWGGVLGGWGWGHHTAPELWIWSYSNCEYITVICQKSNKNASNAGFANRYFLLFFKPTAPAEILGKMGLGKLLWMGTKATACACGQAASCQHFPTVFLQIIVFSYCCHWFPRDGAILLF